MRKNKIMIISTIILSLSFLILPAYENTVYAQNGENNIDSLIENKKYQEELKDKISKLEEEINTKKQSIEDTNNNSNNGESEGIQVVTLSFVEENNSAKENEDLLQSSVETEIAALVQDKYETEKQLEESMIQGVKIEKYIEQEKANYLKANNLQYTSGIWPLESYTTISSPFGERIHPITGELKFHKGIDIPAPQDTDILAADDGIVIYSDTQNGYGNVVKIKHFDGKETIYAHNNSNVVSLGDIVKQGETIAKVGTTGNSTGNHVHFEILVDGEVIDPLNVVTK
ncbi:MAG: M23 family metallopeptidase [Peptostreptococcaceae bacterium]